MHHELRSFDDAAAAAAAAANVVADAAHRGVTTEGAFRLAVSGGRTPQAMFDQLASRDLPWAQTEIFQVDERVAPAGEDSRNLTGLCRALASTPATIRAMPVEDADLDAAARRYAAGLPERLDLVHLGLGPDGHTASLVPGDEALDDTDDLVALTSPYQGWRRMTMTFRALARAETVLWLVTGADKRDALGRLLAGDTQIPAGRVAARHSIVVADRAAL